MRCNTCKVEKEFSAFHRNQRKCKYCASLYAKNLYAKRREEILNRNKAYKSTENGKRSQKLSTEKSRGNSPAKRMARVAVMNALHIGTLVKEPCIQCGGSAEAHHPSYEKADWLNVVWLCRKHHIIEHKMKSYGAV